MYSLEGSLKISLRGMSNVLLQSKKLIFYIILKVLQFHCVYSESEFTALKREIMEYLRFI